MIKRLNRIREFFQKKIWDERGDLMETMLSVIILATVTVSFATLYTAYISSVSKAKTNSQKNNIVAQYASAIFPKNLIESYYGDNPYCAEGTTQKACFMDDTWTYKNLGTANGSFSDYRYKGIKIVNGSTVAQWGKLHTETAGTYKGLLDVYTAMPKSVTGKQYQCDWTQSLDNLYKNCIVSHDTRTSNYQGADGNNPVSSYAQLIFRDGGNFYKDPTNKGTTFADVNANPKAAQVGGANVFGFSNDPLSAPASSQKDITKMLSNSTIRTMALPYSPSTAKGKTSKVYYLMELTNIQNLNKTISIDFDYIGSTGQSTGTHSTCVITPASALAAGDSTTTSCYIIKIDNKYFIRGGLNLPTDVTALRTYIDTDVTTNNTLNPSVVDPQITLGSFYIYWVQPTKVD